MWSFLTIHHSLTTFISASLKTHSMRLLPKQINMQRKQSHLYSKEIVYLSTRGLEIGLMMVTSGDLKAFLAMIIAMGLVNQENIQDYWSTDEVLSTPFFPQIISRDKFKNILTFFHLCNNDNYIPRGQEGYNPVNKLGTIYSVFTGNLSDIWKPGKNICIDEGMDQYGVESYQLCDSCNGYCCMFEIYTGVNPDPPSAKGKTYDLVLRLMQSYLNVGRCLYVDNYYTSPSLFAELYRTNTGAYGTASYRKGIPKNLKWLKRKEKVTNFL